jgi:hypothetical protein
LRIPLLALQVRARGNASGGNRGGTYFKKIATGKLSFIGVPLLFNPVSILMKYHAAVFLDEVANLIQGIR